MEQFATSSEVKVFDHSEMFRQIRFGQDKVMHVLEKVEEYTMLTKRTN